jgi:hypothetical protein
MAIQWSKQSFFFFFFFSFVNLKFRLRSLRAFTRFSGCCNISQAGVYIIRNAHRKWARLCVARLSSTGERERTDEYLLNLFLLRNLWRAIWMMVLVLLGECRVLLRGSPFCPEGCRHFGLVVCRIAKHLSTMATLFIIQTVVTVRVSLSERKQKWNEIKTRFRMKREDVNVWPPLVCVHRTSTLVFKGRKGKQRKKKKKTFTGQDDHSFVEAQLEKRS